VLSDEGELGPLDVQILKRNEIYDYGSGLDTMQTLNVLEERSMDTFRKATLDIHVGAGVTTKLAGELASSLAVGLYAHLYAQLDPVRLGEVYRTMLIASDYGERLVRRGNNAKEGSIGRLVGGYPAHEFVIDREEAAELFRVVRHPYLWSSNISRNSWTCRLIRSKIDWLWTGSVKLKMMTTKASKRRMRMSQAVQMFLLTEKVMDGQTTANMTSKGRRELKQALERRSESLAKLVKATSRPLPALPSKEAPPEPESFWRSRTK
jgi:hypothetical protein